MKICINARFLTQPITGVQRFAIEISRHLRALRQDIVFVSPRDIIHQEIADELKAIPYGTLTGVLWEQLELPRFLRHNSSPLLLNLANTAPVSYSKMIVTIHDLAFLRNPAWFSKAFYLYYRWLIPKIAERASAVITVSEFSKNEISELLQVPMHSIHVVYCGVGNKAYAGAADKAYQPPGKYFLAVSSRDPRKNFEKLIAAFRKLDADNVFLCIVGARNKIFPSQSGDASDRNNVIFAGYISDAALVSLYRNAIALVYPSLYEGFGLPPVEAMANGCPVITSRVASLPEVCENAALYVDPHDVKSITAAMKLMLTDDEQRMVLKTRGFDQIKKFDWQKSARTVSQIIEKSLSSI